MINLLAGINGTSLNRSKQVQGKLAQEAISLTGVLYWSIFKRN